MVSRTPILAHRIRRIAGQGFAFVPHRFLREGFLASLSAHERTLYFFLVLAGDRNGLSFYHYDSICSLLLLTVEDYIEARGGLIRKDLIAFDGTRFQVLSLPPKPIAALPKPLRTREDFEDHDPATIRLLLSHEFAREPESNDT